MSDRRLSRTVSAAAVAGSTEAIVQIASAAVKVCVRQVKVKRATGVSATNIRPRLYNAAGGAADAFTEVFRAAVATVPADLAATVVERYTSTDSLGRLYLKVDGDAADTFSWEVWAEMVQ